MKITKYLPPSRSVLEVSMMSGDLDIISMKRPYTFHYGFGIQNALNMGLAQQQAIVQNHLSHQQQALNQSHLAYQLQAIGQSQSIYNTQPQIQTPKPISTTDKNKFLSWWKK